MPTTEWRTFRTRKKGKHGLLWIETHTLSLSKDMASSNAGPEVYTRLILPFGQQVYIPCRCSLPCLPLLNCRHSRDGGNILFDPDVGVKVVKEGMDIELGVRRAYRRLFSWATFFDCHLPLLLLSFYLTEHFFNLLPSS